MYREVHESILLNPDEVHVWQWELDWSEDAIEAIRQTLSVDEQERADRYYFPSNRARFIAARGILRAILGRYLHIPPTDVAFVYNRSGKPALDRAVHDCDICFNLSHSADLALCAVTRGRAVGIDVEAIREVPDADQIARSQFDAVENASYQALPVTARREGFFLRWTLKEAYVKAHGDGLAIPLDSFTICSTPDAAGYHAVRTGNTAEDRRWTAVRLDTRASFMAAMIVEGSGWKLQYRQLTQASRK